MKKFSLLILISLLLISCGKKVEIAVYNDTNFKRENEMVDLCLCSLKNKIGLKVGDKIIILDSNHKQVPYQMLSDSMTVIFPVTVGAKDSSKYTILIGKPDSIVTKTFGRHVPERKDDFAWENDRIAFRMYGPKLAAENPSNGVDVWLKRTENLIVNKFYKDDLAGKQSYHVDNGEGLDCYKVAHTLGAGGIAPYIDTILFVGSYYNKYNILEKGPLRTVFQLLYDSVKIGDRTIKEKLVITVDAGNQLNKATVEYEDKSKTKMQVAAGIFLHDSIGTPVSEPKKGYIAYAENAVSDAGVPSGRSYVGVIIPTPIDTVITKQKHLLAISNYRADRPFIYYFGAGWSKWGFPKDKDWFDYMEKATLKIKHPLRIIVK